MPVRENAASTGYLAHFRFLCFSRPSSWTIFWFLPRFKVLSANIGEIWFLTNVFFSYPSCFKTLIGGILFMPSIFFSPWIKQIIAFIQRQGPFFPDACPSFLPSYEKILQKFRLGLFLIASPFPSSSFLSHFKAKYISECLTVSSEGFPSQQKATRSMERVAFLPAFFIPVQPVLFQLSTTCASPSRIFSRASCVAFT